MFDSLPSPQEKSRRCGQCLYPGTCTSLYIYRISILTRNLWFYPTLPAIYRCSYCWHLRTPIICPFISAHVFALLSPQTNPCCDFVPHGTACPPCRSSSSAQLEIGKVGESQSCDVWELLQCIHNIYHVYYILYCISTVKAYSSSLWSKTLGTNRGLVRFISYGHCNGPRLIIDRTAVISPMHKEGPSGKSWSISSTDWFSQAKLSTICKLWIVDNIFGQLADQQIKKIPKVLNFTNVVVQSPHIVSSIWKSWSTNVWMMSEKREKVLHSVYLEWV